MAELPDDINKIIEHLADYAERYGGTLKFNEVDRFKSNLMVERGRWLPDRVPIPAFRSKCVDAGLSATETEKLVDFLRKAQSGRRLRQGSRFARGHKYVWPYE